MKKCFPAIFGIFLCPFLFSQILTVNSTSSVSISSGSSITLDGLEIAPDDTYVISGVKSVNYQGLVPVLINALKEQQSEIDELKTMLKTLIEKT